MDSTLPTAESPNGTAEPPRGTAEQALDTPASPGPGGFGKSDFFQAVRRIEARHPELPRVGHARQTSAEAVRIYQATEMDFAATTLETIGGQGDYTEIRQRFFGLLGPHGPMPYHWTEHVRGQVRHDHDATTESFLNIFNHRMATLFYRAWASSRGVVQRDRPEEDRFHDYLSALTGAWESDDTRQARGDAEAGDGSHELRAHFVGRFAGQRRNAEGLRAVLSTALAAAVEVQQFTLQHLRLAPEDLTILRSQATPGQQQLGGPGVLGRSAVLGRSVPDRSTKITVVIGPLQHNRFADLVPGGRQHAELRRLIRSYLGDGLNCRVVLSVVAEAAEPIALGNSGQLGISGWVGKLQASETSEDCHFEL